MTKRLSMSKFCAVSGATDQIFSSLSNGLLIYAVAVVTSTQDFGQIALLLTLLAAAIGILRGALGTPLLLKAGAAQADIRREGSFAVTTALLVSPLVGGIMWAVAGSGIRLPAILIILATPIVLVQDVLRCVAIAEGRPQIAALWHGVWLVGSAALLGATWLQLPVANTDYLLGGWTALAFIALVGMLVAVRIAPRFRTYLVWISDGWQRRVRYGAESSLEQTTAFALLLFVAVFLSPGVVAALRGATALLVPIAITTSAIPLIVLPQSKRQNVPSPQLWNSLARIALVTTSGTILLGLALSFLPFAAGRLVLGSTFDATQSIIPLVAFEYAIGVWVIAVTVWLRASNRGADALKLRAAYVLVMLVTVLGGAVLFRTAAGVATGMATATTFAATLALLRFKPWVTPERRHSVTPFSTRTSRTSRDAHSEVAGAFGAGRDLVYVGMPRPLPLTTRLRLGETTQVNGALLTLWVFATMAVFVPAIFIRFTGVPTNANWLWSLPVLTISAARFAFLIGSGERRLFEMSFWCYSYAFLGLAPLTQLRLDDWPRTVPRIDVTYTGAATLIAVVGCCAFLAGAALDNATSLRLRARVAKRSHDVAKQILTISYSRTVVLCAFAILINIYFLSQVGWLLFLQSREDVQNNSTGAISDNSTLAMVRASACVAPLVAFIALVRFRKEAKNALMRGANISATVMRSNMALLVIVGIVLANIMNPLSSARYLAGTAMLAVAAAFGLFATKLRFRLTACGFLVGMLLVFPLADAFRYSDKGELKSTNPIQSLLSGDYDSFAQLMNGYLVGAREGIVPGKQFLGVLLFWVPRAWWIDKPLDTGPFIANERGYSFTNLSAPLWIEFYLNGGWLLLAVGMFALGFGLHRWDTRLNARLTVDSSPGPLGCILPFYLMILLRGSLLQAISFLFCILVFSAFVSQRRKSKTRPRAPSVVPDQPPGLGVPQPRTDYAHA
jgi:hypothetical protein